MLSETCAEVFGAVEAHANGNARYICVPLVKKLSGFFQPHFVQELYGGNIGKAPEFFVESPPAHCHR